MKSIPQDVSHSVRKRNPHLYGCVTPQERQMLVGGAVEAKRIKQRGREPTKLEMEWERLLRATERRFIRAQSLTFKIANGLRYTPDFTCLIDGETRPVAYEVKGKWIDGDSVPKLKMAAHEWPDWIFILVWKEDGQWKQQVVLP